MPDRDSVGDDDFYPASALTTPPEAAGFERVLCLVVVAWALAVLVGHSLLVAVYGAAPVWAVVKPLTLTGIAAAIWCVANGCWAWGLLQQGRWLWLGHAAKATDPMPKSWQAGWFFAAVALVVHGVSQRWGAGGAPWPGLAPASQGLVWPLPYLLSWGLPLSDGVAAEALLAGALGSCLLSGAWLWWSGRASAAPARPDRFAMALFALACAMGAGWALGDACARWVALGAAANAEAWVWAAVVWWSAPSALLWAAVLGAWCVSPCDPATLRGPESTER